MGRGIALQKLISVLQIREGIIAFISLPHPCGRKALRPAADVRLSWTDGGRYINAGKGGECAMVKPKKRSGGGASWMDTYGDMVTLLLCFFVLLYSMSTISEDKWKAIVQSFNPNAVFDKTEIVGGNDGPSSDPEDLEGAPTVEELESQQAEIEEALEKLYEQLKEYAEQSQMAEQIEVSKGDGYVFVSFSDAVFFRPDKYDLLPEGAQVLAEISGILDQTKDYIDELRIMGHTAQASSSRPNYTLPDRLLSSERAAVATAYIQEHTGIEPARIVSAGYGQHRPAFSNDTEESKSHNRRVEILVTGLDVMDALGDSIEQYELLREDEGASGINITDAAPDAGSESSAAPAE